MSNKEFDRGIAFTFYGEWAQDAATIEEDYGLEGVGMFCKAIYEYALYETEIDAVKKPPLKYCWNTIKEKIDASQEHRARGFSKENSELTQQIIQFKEDNPEASQRDIAEALGCSIGKVNKVLKQYPFTTTPTSTNTITTTSTTTSTSVNVNVNAHDSPIGREIEELSYGESRELTQELAQGKARYSDLMQKYNLKYIDKEKLRLHLENVSREQRQKQEAESAIREHRPLDFELFDTETKYKAPTRRALDSILEDIDDDDEI